MRVSTLLMGDAWIQAKVLIQQMLDLKAMPWMLQALTGLVNNLRKRKKRFRPPPSPGHIRGVNLVAIGNLRMLFEQGAQNTAPTTADVPIDDTLHRQVCGAAGWNMNIE